MMKGELAGNSYRSRRHDALTVVDACGARGATATNLRSSDQDMYTEHERRRGLRPPD